MSFGKAETFKKMLTWIVENQMGKFELLKINKHNVVNVTKKITKYFARIPIHINK